MTLDCTTNLRITSAQKEWLTAKVEQYQATSVGRVGMSDVIRDLIARAMKQEGEANGQRA